MTRRVAAKPIISFKRSASEVFSSSALSADSLIGHCGRAPCSGRIANSTLPDTPQWPPQPRPARSMLRVIKRSAWPVLFSISTTPRDVSEQRVGQRSATIIAMPSNPHPTFLSASIGPSSFACLSGSLPEQHVSRVIQLLGKKVRPTNVRVHALHQAVIGRADFLFGRPCF